jgi:integrase
MMRTHHDASTSDSAAERLLGHADSGMRFNAYTPFVPNIMGWDGEAFEALTAS